MHFSGPHDLCRERGTQPSAFAAAGKPCKTASLSVFFVPARTGGKRGPEGGQENPSPRPFLETFFYSSGRRHDKGIGEKWKKEENEKGRPPARKGPFSARDGKVESSIPPNMGDAPEPSPACGAAPPLLS
ncbi:MAG: hypothetical protein BAA03_06420 [Caldibacillus debilis]|nr:MAG: hypothetical protein BAA03_06420 [Caldibacillus debilis]